jgi:hypothetical protein
MAVPRVLHGERVQLELMGDEIDLFARWVGDVQPAWIGSAKLGELVRRPFDDTVRLFDEKARGHVRSMRGGSGGEAADDVHELLRIEGLREVGLCVAAIRLTARVRDSGEDHERHTSERHAELASERGPIHPRHLHVEDNDRGRIVLDREEGFGTVTRFDDAKATLGKQLTFGGERLHVVVDDQDRAWSRVDPERHAVFFAYGVP